MKKLFYFLLIVIFIVTIIYLIIPLISNSFGWYGYRQWDGRVGTSLIEDSKKRGVFIKELNYKVLDSTNLKGFYFKPYIEKGFNYGFHSMDETRVLKNSKYPYNLSYDRNMKDSIAIYIKKGDEKKLDSFDGAVWGYLKTPYLQDTIYLEINSKYHKGTIKVW